MRKLVAVCAAFCALAFPAGAADLDVSPLGTYAPVRPIYTWTGCRIGANIGAGSARTNWVDTAGTLTNPLTGVGGGYLGDHTASGVIGGGQLGCDYQVGRFVFGIQGVYDLTGMKASNIQPVPATFTVPRGFTTQDPNNPTVTTFTSSSQIAVSLIDETFIQSSANVTARVGYTLQPNILLYGKAGIVRNHNLYNISTPNLQFPSLTATGQGQAVFTLPPAFIVALGNNSPIGPLVGGGLEWAVFGTDVSVFLEYSYVHFGTRQATLLSVLTPARGATLFPIDISQNLNMVLFGINYRFFGGGPGY